jgi:hypothetical protein
MKHKIALVLLHYPITSRKGDIIATAVTNMDLHDLSRSARTYEVDHYFVVTPVKEQQEIVGRILDHWKLPRSQEWHPDRFEALSRLQMVSDFAAVKADLNSRHPGLELEVCLPDARPLPNQLGYQAIRQKWKEEPKPGVKVIVLGTGWGVAPEFYPEVHTYLAPLDGPLGREGYNHLSVRAAGAIILDRLFGTQN